MVGNNDKKRQKQKLTSRQIQGVGALLTSRTIIEAAAQVGVTERTFNRWLLIPDFQDELKSQESTALESVTRRLVGLSDLAIQTIGDILENGENPVNTRLRAAESCLSNMMKLRDVIDIENRIKKLEDQTKEKYNE